MHVYKSRHKLPKWNGRFGIDGPIGPREALRIMRSIRPEWDRALHFRREHGYEQAARLASQEWARESERAALETWGRSFRPQDYRISGIASDEFSPARKARLRKLAHAIGICSGRAAAHRHAARYWNRAA